MNLLSSYRHKYYLHQAYSRYPKVAFAADLAKAATFTGFVAMVGWISYSLSVHQSDSVFENISQLARSVEVTNPLVNEDESFRPYAKVEIPAASTVTQGVVPVPLANGNATKPTIASVTETTSPTDQKIIYTSGWISRLPADKYIIQVASSTDRELLLKDALAFPYGPVAIYPFNKSKRKTVIYGLSAGVYNSFDDARRAFDILPEEVVANGPWIRQISTLKKQIQKLSVDS